MKRLMQFAAIIAFTVALFQATPASARHRWRGGGYGFVPGYRQAFRHQPYSSLYVDFLPRRYGAYDFNHDGGYFAYGHYPLWNYGPTFPYGYGGGFYPYQSYYGYGYGIGVGVYPPTIPAETLYGPAALQRFINPGGAVNVPPAINRFDNVLPLGPRDVRIIDDQPKVRISNAEARDRAWRFINIGDDYFDKQQYRQAYHRYREAAEAAPDVLDAYLRQGQAMLAAGQYEIAATAFKRALKIEPRWPQSKFRLDDIYGGQRISKTAHLEALADAADKEPQDGNLVLLVGLHLHFDGQPERARLFLQRADRMLADDSLHLAEAAENGGVEAQEDAPEKAEQVQF